MCMCVRENIALCAFKALFAYVTYANSNYVPFGMLYMPSDRWRKLQFYTELPVIQNSTNPVPVVCWFIKQLASLKLLIRVLYTC